MNGNGRYDVGEPFQDINKNGVRDLIEDPWKGYSPVAYQDRGVHYYLGNNTGLVHSYVDSNNVINGQTYFYAVVSYDHGDTIAIPPTECTKKVTVDPITSQYKLDVNTAMVVPGPRASGYISPAITTQNVAHDNGIGTGDVSFRILNDRTIREGGQYQISFGDSVLVSGKQQAGKNFSVLDLLAMQETFSPFDTNYAALGHSHLANDSYLKVTGNNGTVYVPEKDYVLILDRGSIRRTGASSMQNNGQFTIQYRYYPVFQSQALKAEDTNPVFDGVQLRIADYPVLAYGSTHSQWVSGNSRYSFTARLTKSRHPPEDVARGLCDQVFRSEHRLGNDSKQRSQEGPRAL